MFFVTLGLLSLFVIKPLVKRTIRTQVYDATDSTYVLSFEKFNFNVFTGNLNLVNFKLSPDTTTYFAKHTKVEKNLYEISLDTFKIEHLRFWDLLGKSKKLAIKRILWVNPKFAVYGAIKQDTTNVKLQQKSVSYQAVRQDVISSAFEYVNAIKIDKIELRNGNFDFLKPRADNPNPFSMQSVTFILNNFRADKNTFSTKPKDIFSENIEMIITGYHLNLNDNIHVLDAGKLYLNTADKIIELSDISMKPDTSLKIDFDTLNSNLIDFSIKKIKFVNADFKDIYINNRLYLSRAYVEAFDGKMYKQKLNVVKKSFNKDSLINKIDIYKLFSNYLTYVKIDTLELLNGAYSQYDRYSDNLERISVANIRFAVYNFFIDSTSFMDTSRILYSKAMELNMYGFKMRMNDAIHTLTADYVVASTADDGLLARDVKIVGDEDRRSFAVSSHKSFNNIEIEELNVAGFNFNRFVNFDELIVDKIKMKKSAFELNSYTLPKGQQSKVSSQELVKLFQNFAKKIIIDKIEISDGSLNYHSEKSGKNIYVRGRYKANVYSFVFAPYSEKITKWVSVGGIDVILTDFYLNTADSIYQLTADTLKYSTHQSDLQLINARFKPIEDGLISRMKRHRKSFTFEIDIPRFVISNTNISSALQADSLSLKNIILNNPRFILKFYPDIKPKTSNKAIVKYIKKRAIANIVTTSTESEVTVYSNTQDIDSNTYEILKIKRRAIDTITKVATHTILLLNVRQKQVDFSDTTVGEITQIEQIANESIKSIVADSLSADDVQLLMYQALVDIDYIVGSDKWAKIDKEEIFKQIGAFLPKIVSDTFVVNNGSINLENISDTLSKTVFRTIFDLSLYGFSFDTTNLDSTNRILFSDNFIFSIENTVFNLSDSIHQVRIKKLSLNSELSSVLISGIKIAHRSFDEDKLIYDADIQKIVADGVDYRQLYFEHNFYVNSLDFYSPHINIYLPKIKSSKAEAKKLPLKFLLPNKVSSVNIKDIKTHSGKIKLTDRASFMYVKCGFDFDLINFQIDSVTLIKDNLLFLPIENFTFDIENFQYLSKDSLQKAVVSKIGINTANGALNLQKLTLSSIVPDTTSVFEFTKCKNILNIDVAEVDIAGFDIAKYRFDKLINIRKFIVDNPQIYIIKQQKEQPEKFDINNIDLYEKIKKFTPQFLCNYLKISMLNYKTRLLSDTLDTLKKLPLMNLTFTDLLIDSASRIDTPQLFYAKDFSFDVYDVSGFSKDSIYKYSMKKISGSTEDKTLNLTGLAFVPTVPLQKVQDFYEWRTTAMSADMRSLKVSKLDYYNLIFKQKLIAQSIIGDSIVIYTFVDRNAKHNDSLIQKHFIEHILDFKYPLDIRLVDLKDLTLYYSELSDKNQQLAYISLTRAELKIIRVTNDSAKIAEKDLYSLINATGYINDTAEINLQVFYKLNTRGNTAKVIGSIGECEASVFNSYLVNGANLRLDNGVIHSLDFAFTTDDSLAVGKLKMRYDDLKVSFLSKDTLKRKKLKFISWVADVLFVKNSNPKYGVYVKPGKIAYIHDRTYSDVKMWLKALLSGIKSTVAYEPKDAKKIRKIMRKNKKNIKQEK